MVLSGYPGVRCNYSKDRIIHGLAGHRRFRVFPDIFGRVRECIAHPGVLVPQ